MERKRGCGWRKVGKLYLVGRYIEIACDRLPLPLTHCPTCGAGIYFTRSMTEINPLKLFGEHQQCSDYRHPCMVCDPGDEVAYIMMVGDRPYPTPEHFMQEARIQGVSKCIPFIPKKMVLGKTPFFLAHKKGSIIKEPVTVRQAEKILEQAEGEAPRLIDDGQKYNLGIFAAFMPKRVEKICWKSEYTKENIERSKKRGIKLVPVPDGDTKHAPIKRFKKEED